MAISAGNSPESRDIASVLHPYTNLVKHEETGPLVIARGEGVWVYDNTGKGYIEGLAGLWSTSLGFGEERLDLKPVADGDWTSSTSVRTSWPARL